MMRKNSAITFIELLVVIIIIGILAGVSISRFRKTFDNFQLDNFVKDLYYLSRYLQTAAISENKIYSLNIYPRQGKLRAAFKDEKKDEFQNFGGRYGKEYVLPPDTLIAGPAEDKAVYFYPDGSAGEAAITFENRHQRRVSLSIKGAGGAITLKEGPQ